MLRGRSTFRSKVFFPILLLVLATVASMGCIFALRQSAILEKDLEKRGQSLVMVLAKNLKVGILTGSDEYLDEAIKSALDVDDVLAVRVYDSGGKVLRDMGKKDLHRQTVAPKPELFAKDLSGRVSRFEEYLDLTAPVYYVESGISRGDLEFYPVETGRTVVIGSVVLSLSKEGIVSARKDARNLAVVTALLFCFFGGLTAYSIASRVTLPLSDLVRNIRDMQVHGLRDLPVRGDYEIRELSVAFNMMAEALKKREQEVISTITDKRRLEEQLQQAQKMEAVGQLAGGIAHDFNNILSAIVGYGDLLHTAVSSDATKRVYVEHILEAAERGSEVTHGLLAFSRKQLMSPSPVNINDIVRRFVKLLSRLIGEDIELRTELMKRDITIMADAGQIDQVLMNLVTNARDAMPRGGTLTLRTGLFKLDYTFIQAHGYGEPGLYVLVSVSDTGVGMEVDTRAKIFEPFFTTKDVGKGTGLGLAMVYGIIKQHDGYITVESAPGKGATFTAYLPAMKTGEEALSETAVVSEPGGGTETILVAEDDETLRKLSNIVLKEYGYHVILAEDGEDATKKFMANRDKIHLVILDMIMPKKSGREAYEEIRTIRPDVKVLFASGYTADRMDKDTITEKGFDFIMKPAPPKELLRKIREVLDR